MKVLPLGTKMWLTLLGCVLLVGCANPPPPVSSTNGLDYVTAQDDSSRVFNKALDALPPTGGVLSVRPGRYEFNTTVTTNKPNIFIVGDEDGEVVISSNTTVVFRAGGSGWVFKNLVINTPNSVGIDVIDMGDTKYWLQENITVNGETHLYRQYPEVE